MKIIVTGHGNFASGLASTVKLLAGSLKDVEFIDFSADLNDQQLHSEFENAISETDQVVFFCDLLGGTPFKEAVKLASDTPSKEISVTVGCNIGALMEIGLQLANFKGSAKELAQKLVTTSQQQTKVFEHHQVQTISSDEDGI